VNVRGEADRRVRPARRGSAAAPAGNGPVLLADPEAADQLRVAVRVLPLQVIEQAAALSDQLEQPAPRMVVLRVGLEVFRQIVDSLAEERDLNFR
jgi:hypothetical protein